MISGIAGYVNAALDRVTESYSGLRDVFRPAHRITLEEGRDGIWRQAGRHFIPSQVEVANADVTLILDPSRFLVLTLPLPVGAKPYLRGVVASQIDRISPWSAEQAVYGATITSETQQGLNVRIAVAARDEILRRIGSLRLDTVRSMSLRIATTLDGVQLPIDIPIESQNAQAPLRDRRIVQSVFYSAIVFAILAEIARFGFAGATETALRQTRSDIAKLRETLAGTVIGGDFKADPMARMVHAKAVTVPTVELADTLAAAVPDHTYLTAFEIEPQKIHIEGISTSVTDLPKAIGEKAIFGDVTFSAPTAKRRDGAGETFQIDIAIKPRQAGEP